MAVLICAIASFDRRVQRARGQGDMDCLGSSTVGYRSCLLLSTLNWSEWLVNFFADQSCSKNLEDRK